MIFPAPPVLADVPEKPAELVTKNRRVRAAAKKHEKAAAAVRKLLARVERLDEEEQRLASEKGGLVDRMAEDDEKAIAESVRLTQRIAEVRAQRSAVYEVANRAAVERVKEAALEYRRVAGEVGDAAMADLFAKAEHAESVAKLQMAQAIKAREHAKALESAARRAGNAGTPWHPQNTIEGTLQQLREKLLTPPPEQWCDVRVLADLDVLARLTSGVPDYCLAYRLHVETRELEVTHVNSSPRGFDDAQAVYDRVLTFLTERNQRFAEVGSYRERKRDEVRALVKPA